MRKVFIFLFIWCWCFYGSFNAFGQSQKISQLEQQASVIETELTELLKIKRQLEQESDSLAKELSTLRMGPSSTLGILDRYKLEEKLKDSQTLSRKLQGCEKELTKARDRYREAAEELIVLYNREIKTIIESINKKSDKSESTYLQSLYDKRNKWREKIPERSSVSLILFDVTIDSLDSPRRVREKADLVKDMEEDVRSKVKLLEKRLSELKEEKKVRDKMGDFLQEITLFTDRERGRAGNEKSIEQGETFKDFVSTKGTEESVRSNESSAISRDQSFRFWQNVENLDPSSLSQENIEQLITGYSKVIEQLRKRAEDLHGQAQSFYKRAESPQ
ncbi:MAG: hypothetical protein M1426_04960 [Patescibacteria group bacterium]|nr:hypothetical protein [Patescibacteria group bacterium]